MSRKVKIKRKSSLKPLKKIPLLKKIQAKPKLLKIKRVGRWCDYYEGRLPYPIECSNNKKIPKKYIYEGTNKTLVKDTSKCPNCERSIQWHDWKAGKWDKIKEGITKGYDLRDQPSPVSKEF